MAEKPQVETVQYHVYSKDGVIISMIDSVISIKEDDGKMYAYGLAHEARELFENKEINELKTKEISAIIEDNSLSIMRYDSEKRKATLSSRLALEFHLPIEIDNAPSYFVSNGYLDNDSSSRLMALFDAIDAGKEKGVTFVNFGEPNTEKRYFQVRYTIIARREKDYITLISFKDMTSEEINRISYGIEKEALVEAAKTTFSLCLLLNLTKNSYQVLIKTRNIFTNLQDTGELDDFIQTQMENVYFDNQKDYIDTFKRDNLIKSHEEGIQKISLIFRLKDNKGIYHYENVRVIFLENSFDNSIIAVGIQNRIDKKIETEKKAKQYASIESGETAEFLNYLDIINTNVSFSLQLYNGPFDKDPIFSEGKLFGDNLSGIALASETRSKKEKEFNNLRSLMRKEFQKQANEGKDYFTSEFSYNNPSGTSGYLFAKAKKYHEGTVDGYFVVIFDDTEREVKINKYEAKEKETKIAFDLLHSSYVHYSIKEKMIYLPDKIKNILNINIDRVSPNSLLHGLSIVDSEINNEIVFEQFFKSIDDLNDSRKEVIAFNYPDESKHYISLTYQIIKDDVKYPDYAIITLNDITEYHKKYLSKITSNRSEAVLRFVAEHSERIVYFYDRKTKNIIALDAVQAKNIGLFGNVNKPFLELLQKNQIFVDSIPSFESFIKDIDDENINSGETKIHMKTNHNLDKWFDARFSSFPDDSLSVIVSFFDITEEHERQILFERYRDSSNQLKKDALVFFEGDLISDIIENQDGIEAPNVSYVGKSFDLSMFSLLNNYIPEDVKEQTIVDFSKNNLLSAYKNGQENIIREWQLKNENGTRWVNASIQLLNDPFNYHIIAFVFLVDVTKEKNETAAFKKAAEIDLMTGLYNKMTAVKLIKSYLKENGANKSVLLEIDLDDLKKINDSLGHAEGDQALIAISSTIKNHFRKVDIVARTGGDEFLVFLKNVSNQESIINSIMQLERKISMKTVGNPPIVIHSSIGVTFGTNANESYEMLFIQADKALYEVKKKGKNDVVFYTPNMEKINYEYKDYKKIPSSGLENISHIELLNLANSLLSSYPLVVILNLSQMTYFVSVSSGLADTYVGKTGTIDELAKDLEKLCDEENKEILDKTISRDNYILAFANKENEINTKLNFKLDGETNIPFSITSILYRSDVGEASVCVAFRSIE